jgi:hypothetical protein
MGTLARRTGRSRQACYTRIQPAEPANRAEQPKAGRGRGGAKSDADTNASSPNINVGEAQLAPTYRRPRRWCMLLARRPSVRTRSSQTRRRCRPPWCWSWRRSSKPERGPFHWWWQWRKPGAWASICGIRD